MSPFNVPVPHQAKAIAAGAVTGIVALVQAFISTTADNRFDGGDLITVIIATLAAYGITFGVPNRDGGQPQTSPAGPVAGRPGALDFLDEDPPRQ